MLPSKQISDNYTIQICQKNILSYLILTKHYDTWTALISKEKVNLNEEINQFNEWIIKIDKEKQIRFNVEEQQTIDLQNFYWKNIYKIRGLKDQIP